MTKLITSALLMLAVACGGAPKTQSERATAEQQARAALDMMTAKDPTLRPLINNAAGIVVFPEVGKGGFIAGAAHGKGVLFERGQATGYVELSQGSIGAQIGAESFAELIVLRDTYNLQRLKDDTFSVGANVSAVALSAGVAGAADMREGVAVFIVPRGGLMAELSVSGQQLDYTSKGG